MLPFQLPATDFGKGALMKLTYQGLVVVGAVALVPLLGGCEAERDISEGAQSAEADVVAAPLVLTARTGPAVGQILADIDLTRNLLKARVAEDASQDVAVTVRLGGKTLGVLTKSAPSIALPDNVRNGTGLTLSSKSADGVFETVVDRESDLATARACSKQEVNNYRCSSACTAPVTFLLWSWCSSYRCCCPDLGCF
jgi:hypothetical protein